MKKFVVLLLLIPTLSFAGDLSVGGGFMNGHSYSGDYSVDTGYSALVTYDKHLNSWPVRFGVGFNYLNYTRGDNRTGEDKTTDDYRGMAYAKPYWDLNKYFQPFALVGGGFALADQDEMFGAFGAGFDTFFTENWGIGTTGLLSVGESRNVRQVILSIKYRF